MLAFVLERANYWAIIGLMMVGLYITFQSTNYIKQLVGLSIFQTSVFLFYITLGKVAGGTAPILYGKDAKGHGDSHDNVTHGAVHGVAELSDDSSLEISDGEAAEIAGAPNEHSIGDVDETANIAIDTGVPDAVAGEASHDHAQLGLTGLQEVYSNPLPHVLILTAIVVGVATLSVGLAIVVRIREAYGTIEADEVRQKDIEIAEAQDADDPVVVGAS